MRDRLKVNYVVYKSGLAREEAKNWYDGALIDLEEVKICSLE